MCLGFLFVFVRRYCAGLGGTEMVERRAQVFLRMSTLKEEAAILTEVFVDKVQQFHGGFFPYVAFVVEPRNCLGRRSGLRALP